MPEIENVVVLLRMADDKKKELEAILPGANYIYSNAQEVEDSALQSADVILGSLHPDRVKDLTRLKWMQVSSAGTDRYQKEGAFPKQAVLTNAKGGYGLVVAEFMVGLVFTLIRKLHNYRDYQNEGVWGEELDVTTVSNSTVLVIGMGDIGREFAKRMKAMGCYIIGVTRSSLTKPEYVDEVYTVEKLDELLPRADIVSLSVPSTDETKRIISKERIGMLKKSAVIINIGRGTAIDTESLANALERGQIQAAALDVVDPEPLPAGHRLWKMKNVLITPHVAGNYGTDDATEKIDAIFLSNFRAYVNGEELKNIVDFNKGY